LWRSPGVVFGPAATIMRLPYELFSFSLDGRAYAHEPKRYRGSYFLRTFRDSPLDAFESGRALASTAPSRRGYLFPALRYTTIRGSDGEELTVATRKKGRPLSIRLGRDFEELLELEAERAGIPKTRMLERLAEEALRMRRFPGIVFRGPEHRRRAAVAGTGMDVWEVLMLHGAEGRETLLETHPLTERQLDVALAYHLEYPEEIDRFLEENGRPPEHWQKLYPGLNIGVHRLEDAEGG
jgi:uncharacterized protein (DUF433 family)